MIIKYALLIGAVLWLDQQIAMTAIESASDKEELIKATVGHMGYMILYVASLSALLYNVVRDWVWA